ncbi:hypothetical protein HX137_02925 [Pseudomonas sp. 165]|uniref:hypothetical protein n=1 Tax=Pseudomonas sp. 165 TaxID=2746722 RepID=UPI002575B89A|nr:hypothetical protein [Pseudomonas sp. 165]MDM1709587.1 hypothetical protein [Pseudomonas sp. 165]
MANVIRLTQDQKVLFAKLFEQHGDSYELNNSEKLNAMLEECASSFENLPKGDEHVLISKTEVHPQIWKALEKSGVSLGVENFDNGDEDPEYQKSMKVEKNLFEALIALLAALLEMLTSALTGRHAAAAPGADGGGRETRRRPRVDNNGYEP